MTVAKVKWLTISICVFLSPLGNSLLALERQPNILVFLMDDMGYGDVHALNPNGSGFETPPVSYTHLTLPTNREL